FPFRTPMPTSPPLVGTTRFPAPASPRPGYSSSPGTQTVLAALIPPLAILALTYAVRARFSRHVRLARWTFPTWLYVSVTGVVIYVMLYHLYPAGVPLP